MVGGHRGGALRRQHGDPWPGQRSRSDARRRPTKARAVPLDRRADDAGLRLGGGSSRRARPAQGRRLPRSCRLRALARGSRAPIRWRLAAEQEVVDEPGAARVRRVREVRRRVVQYCCGLHVHVGVASAEECLAALEAMLPWLPIVLALSVELALLRGSRDRVCIDPRRAADEAPANWRAARVRLLLGLGGFRSAARLAGSCG